MRVILVSRLMLALAAAQAWAQTDFGDIRNLPVDTRTRFAAARYRSLEQWQERHASLRRQILASAGLDPLPDRNPLNARRFGLARREGFSVEKVTIDTLPGFHLAGNLYLPAKLEGRAPAVLVLHGHWKHGRVEDLPEYSVPALCANLAAQGYVVFTHDMLGYNDTRQLPHEFGNTAAEQLWSFNPLGIQLWNSMRALDFLQSLGEADPDRIGVTGASGGGTQTFLLAAVDARVRASAPVVMVSASFQGDDACEMAPGLRVGANNVEIAAMAAPRPMLLISSTHDWTKNTPAIEFPAIQSVYRLHGKPESVESVQTEARHNYNEASRQAVYRFLDRSLRTGGGPAVRGWDEIRDTGLSPEDLLIGAAAARNQSPAIFAQWREMAAGQSSRFTGAELRDTLASVSGVAWPARVTAIPAGEQTLLGRAGRGDRIPSVWTPGAGRRTAIVVHPGGTDEARRLPELKALAAEGWDILWVDAYQTGAAGTLGQVIGRDYLTFHRSADANRAQDVLTAIAYAAVRKPEAIRMVCPSAAAAWCWLAVAMAPAEIPLEAAGAPPGGDDIVFRKSLFIPGILRVGGRSAIERLIEARRPAITSTLSGGQ